MNKIVLTCIICFTLLTSNILFAQEMTSPEMADVMRSEGKIYVVVAILVIIFAGLIAYVVTLDRKLTRLEKKITDKKG
ncbi:MAG: CcmD family protein [Cyclobacteriaceae bacterium]|jgi:CcmD family protein|nr:CcmD family protein [Cyclobacteriaceae bacterium]